jgi:hypothetical protein
MIEYSVGTRWNKDENSIIIPSNRLYLIGCIGVWSNALERFPLPMLAIDGEPTITKFDTVTRVEGLLPSESNPHHLIRGNWTAQVDIRSDYPNGEGEVYLGNANSPSETWGYIFDRAIPFNPELELGFVYEPEEQDILWERDYDGDIGYLVYSESTVLESLRRVHTF